MFSISVQKISNHATFERVRDASHALQLDDEGARSQDREHEQGLFNITALM